jgi:hypothetical protein
MIMINDSNRKITTPPTHISILANSPYQAKILDWMGFCFPYFSVEENVAVWEMTDKKARNTLDVSVPFHDDLQLNHMMELRIISYVSESMRTWYDYRFLWIWICNDLIELWFIWYKSYMCRSVGKLGGFYTGVKLINTN